MMVLPPAHIGPDIRICTELDRTPPARFSLYNDGVGAFMVQSLVLAVPQDTTFHKHQDQNGHDALVSSRLLGQAQLTRPFIHKLSGDRIGG